MTREQADGLLASLEAQVERVRNNGARRRLRKALEAAKAKRARTLEIERLRSAKRERVALLTETAPYIGGGSAAGLMEPGHQRSGKMEAAQRAADEVRPMFVPRKSLVLTDLRGP